MFGELSPRVFAYARRHCDVASAQDVTADTFLVAWRRWLDVPSDPLPWLLVVARNTMANRRRHELRQARLVDAVAQIERATGPEVGADHHVVEKDALLAGLRALTEAEREALLLVSWDGLTGPQAAVVAGCSLRAFEVRLSRGRARLTRTMADRSSEGPTRGTSRNRPVGPIKDVSVREAV